MGNRRRLDVGCGPDGCGQYVEEDGERGMVVDTVTLEDGRVCEIEWPDGTVELRWNAADPIGHRIDHQPPKVDL